MKYFIKKILLFGLIVTIIFVAIFIGNTLLITYSKFPLRKVNTLIVGDSHANQINPNLFESAANISQPAEPFTITKWKLDYLIPRLNPDTIILSLSHHNISGVEDDKLYDAKWRDLMIERTYLFDEYLNVTDQPIDRKRWYYIYFKQMFLKLHSNHFKFIGKHRAPERSFKNNTEDALQTYFFYKRKTSDVSELAIQNLNTIISYCIQKKIVIYLVGTPVHASYYSSLPDNIVNRYDAIIAELREKNIKILDYSMNFLPESHFFNADHLNAIGSRHFSETLLKDIKGNPRTH